MISRIPYSVFLFKIGLKKLYLFRLPEDKSMNRATFKNKQMNGVTAMCRFKLLQKSTYKKMFAYNYSLHKI